MMENKAIGRGQATRTSMMRAAEKLFAIHGFENVSVRAIITEANQKNESALQYHFGGRAGLIRALQKERNQQVKEKRLELLRQMPNGKDRMNLRDVCTLMVKPAFLLCRSDPSFKDFLSVFGQLLLSSGRPVISVLEDQEGKATKEMATLLRKHLPGYDDELFQIRFENAARFALQCMSKHAREKGAFRGRPADFFISNLVDTLTAMMAAEISAETRLVFPAKAGIQNSGSKSRV